MSNKLSPLFNSTSALLEFQIWSGTTSHAIPLKSCATTGKNWFELVTASLNHVLPTRNDSTPWPLQQFPIFPPDDLYRKNMWLRTMCCLQNEPVTYSHLLTKHCPQCSKWTITQYTHTTQLHIADRNYPWPFYLFSRSQQSLTKCNLFCCVLKVRNCHLIALIVLVPQ